RAPRGTAGHPRRRAGVRGGAAAGAGVDARVPGGLRHDESAGAAGLRAGQPLPRPGPPQHGRGPAPGAGGAAMTLDLPRLAVLAPAREPRLLFRPVGGAPLYGFPSEDSDVDLRGCHRLPLTALSGLSPPAETCDAKLDGDGSEVELVSHEVGK